MMKILFAIFCLSLVSIVYGAQEAYIEYQIGGSLSSSSEQLEKFEMDFDRQIKWFSNSTGGLDDPYCATDVGEYKGKLSEKDAELLISKARDAIKNVKPNTGEHAPVKGVTKRLKLVIDDESLSANLATADEMPRAWQELEKLIKQFGSELMPSKLMNMSSLLLSNNKIQIRFQYWGKRPVVLILPSDPNQVFSANGYQFEYAVSPAQELQQLSPLRKNIDVVLKYKITSENASLSKIFYSNKPALHHADMDFTKGYVRPLSANLCSVVKKR